jgi:hypothetical protein
VASDESLPSNPVLPLRSLERRAWRSAIVFASSHELLFKQHLFYIINFILSVYPYKGYINEKYIL